MKKFRNLCLVLSICALVVVSIVTVPETSEAATPPDRIYVDYVHLVCKSIYCEIEPQFFSRTYDGYLYRGYLTFKEPIIGDSAYYHGWLYRSPLPYPTPYSIPDLSYY